ncbi:MAG: IclR family transcriptional regulator [Pseudorhodobacter sp.]
MSDGPSTVIKALTLLDFFGEQRSHIGLSEFSKLTGYNKASTLRFLTALQMKGFVEQDESTRSYRIGPAFLRFAHLREATMPMGEAVRVVLRDLAAATKETAHASIISGEALANIATVESRRANRVSIEPGEVLPFHATSSGLAVLAFADITVLDAMFGRQMERYAPNTIIDPHEIHPLLEQIREAGYARSTASYEDGVTGIAAPYFSPSGEVCGSVAVAMPTIRATQESERLVIDEVRAAARRLTELRGGHHPDYFPVPAYDI